MRLRERYTYSVDSPQLEVHDRTNDREAAVASARWHAERLADRSEDGYIEVTDASGSVVNIDVYAGTVTEEWR